MAQEKFRAAGHEITHDWTRNETGDKLLAGNEAKLANKEETSHRAQLDLQGVIDCDVYVICTDNEEIGKGMYVELGAALALHATANAPQIYLVGKMNHMLVFYFHPAVIRVDTVEEVIEAIR